MPHPKPSVARRRLKLAAIAAALVAVLVTALLVLDFRAQHSGPLADPWPLELPDPKQTVALARVDQGTLILRTVSDTHAEGALLQGSPLDAYTAHGLDGLQALRDAGPAKRYPLTALLPPVPSAPPHIGSGNNFAAHREEVGLHNETELFPKMSTPTAWNAPVPLSRRLDHEVELCAVTLAPVTPKSTAELGYVLCNDFTDRWTMMVKLDTDTPLGTTGFADGKGNPGYFPTGPWMVIAKNPDAFAAAVKLRLTVNGRVYQDASQSLAAWDHRRILQGAFEDCGLDFRYHDGPVAWPGCNDTIPAGTLILGGTPSGVVFRPLTVWAWWKYLAPGDEVITEATGLGRLVNRVVP